MRERLKEMKSEISDQDLMLHVLAYIPDKYSIVGQLARNKLNDTNNPLALK